MEAAEALELMRKNCELFANAYWKQLAPGPELRRFFWSGKGQHRVFAEEENFSRYLRGKLKDCFLYRRPPPEAHGSLDLTLKPKAPVDFYRPESPCCGRIMALDLDLREVPLEVEEARARFSRAVEFLYDWGVEPEVRVSGGGFHLTFLPPPVPEPERVNAELAEFLGRRFGLRFDTKLYGGHHLMRLSFSRHGKGIFTLPLHPWELEELRWDELQLLAADPSEIEERLKGYGLKWQPLGGVAEPETAEKLLAALKPVEIEPPPTFKLRGRGGGRPPAGSWRVCEAPDLGRVEYAAELEGHGWVRTLVEKGVYVKDGKLNMAWLVLAPAVARGVLSEAEAEEWLRKAAEACGANPEPYLKKLEGEVRRRVGKPQGSPELALPTWRSLLTMRKKDGSPLESYYQAVRKPLLEALAEKGLVRLRGAGSEKAPSPAGF